MNKIKDRIESGFLALSIVASAVTTYIEFQSLKCELWEEKLQNRRIRQEEINNPILTSNREDALEYHKLISSESIRLIGEIEQLKRKLTNCN